MLHDWCNNVRGMCYPVCGMVHLKEPLLLVGKSSPCGGSGFPLSLSEWSFTICMTPYNRKYNVLSASLNKKCYLLTGSITMTGDYTKKKKAKKRIIKKKQKKKKRGNHERNRTKRNQTTPNSPFLSEYCISAAKTNVFTAFCWTEGNVLFNDALNTFYFTVI